MSFCNVAIVNAVIITKREERRKGNRVEWGDWMCVCERQRGMKREQTGRKQSCRGVQLQFEFIISHMNIQFSVQFLQFIPSPSSIPDVYIRNKLCSFSSPFQCNRCPVCVNLSCHIRSVSPHFPLFFIFIGSLLY